MSAPVLTRWPVAVTLDVETDQIGPDGRVSDAALAGWLNRGRSEYFDRLPPDLRAGLKVTSSHIVQRRSLPVPGAVTVSVSVIELRQRTFDMQVRVREKGPGAIVASGGCTVAMIDRATSEQVDLPMGLREALIRLEKTAVFYC